MSSSASNPTQTPSQIFAQLMATGAIDRFRKSLEKLIQPLSQARHQSISQATESFLHDLPAVDDTISKPKQLLKDAKRATMTSVREDVIKDVQQTAVSEGAEELRLALRHAFETIIDPPKAQSEPASKPSEPSPFQPQPICPGTPQNAKTAVSPTTKLPNAEQDNKFEAPKQSLPGDSQTFQANNRSIQHSKQSQSPEADSGTRAPQPIANQKPASKYATSPSIQTIPTDLFQTAHNILELKAKEKEVKASLAAKESRNEEPTQSHGAEEHSSPRWNDAQTEQNNARAPESHDRPTLQPSRDLEGATKRGVDSQSPQHEWDKEREAGEHEGDTTNDGGIDRSPTQAPQALDANGSRGTTRAKVLPRKRQVVAAELKNKSDVETTDVKTVQDEDTETPKATQRRGRKRRKPPAKLILDNIGTRKRRRNSQLQHDVRIEGEEGGTGKRKRGRKETASTPSKRPRKIRRRDDIVANRDSELVMEKRSGRKRGKGSDKRINPAVATLIDPQNPNRPRGYEVLEPTCIPEDHEVQARVLQVLENLLEHEYSSPFAEPVDLGDEGQSSYLQEIMNPMDLGTITKRLKEGTPQRSFFKNVNEIFADIELVWWNCARFNGELDPVVQDMNNCRAELSVHIEYLLLDEENAKTPQGPLSMCERTDMKHIETREEKSEGDQETSNTKQKQLMNSSGEDPSDLNNGQLLGKEGAIFKYVEGEEGSKRKEWSLCTVTDYDATSRSYTLLWADKSETRRATIGSGCMFNVHRFRTD